MRFIGTAALLFCCLVVGVMVFMDPPPDRRPPATADQLAIGRARAALAVALREPDSAKVGPMFIGRAGHVCGTVNGKNGFGGFTGMKPFVFRISTRGLMFDNASWNAYCAGVTYSVDTI